MGQSQPTEPWLLDEETVPYFLWDRHISVARLREILGDRTHPMRIQLLQVLLREAKTEHVWHFLSPLEVTESWEAVRPGLGRRRPVWEWLLDAWRKHGYLP